MVKRDYKYTEKDCDIILGIDSENSECFIIPIKVTENWGESISVKKLNDYKENWNLFRDIAKEKD